MPEADRLKLGGTAVTRLRSLLKGLPRQISRFAHLDASRFALAMHHVDQTLPRTYRATQAAVLATASFSQWKSVKRHALPSNDVALAILTDRRPSWVGELVEIACEEEDDRLESRWPLFRGLIREGLCSPPQSGRYIERMLPFLQRQGQTREGGLRQVLLDDPALLEHEIWRIFTTEPRAGAIDLMTARTRGFPADLAWEVALAQLASEGRISRQRLLDACLEGLSPVTSMKSGPGGSG